MARRRRRSLLSRLLIAAGAAAFRHAHKHGKRAFAAAGGTTGPKTIRRASEEYGGKRKAGTPIPVWSPPQRPAATKADRWYFLAMIGNYAVAFEMVADLSITELDDPVLLHTAMAAACQFTHDSRPFDEHWPLTQISPTNEAARAQFGEGLFRHTQ